MPDINWFAAALAGVIGFFSGGLWYSPLLLQRAWSAETGMTEGHAGNVAPAVRFGTGALLSVISAVVFAVGLGARPTLGFAVGSGLAVGLAIIVPSYGIQYLFENRSPRLLLINGGWHCLQFALFGLILGLWH